MKKNTNDNKQYEYYLLPYPVIVNAVNGDSKAMEIVLLHFENYITALATQEFYDSYGNICFTVNEELRACLRLRLIQAVLLFKI